MFGLKRKLCPSLTYACLRVTDNRNGSNDLFVSPCTLLFFWASGVCRTKNISKLTYEYQGGTSRNGVFWEGKINVYLTFIRTFVEKVFLLLAGGIR